MPGKIFGTALVLFLVFAALLAGALNVGEQRMLNQWSAGRVSDAVPASDAVSPAEP